ncbi:MAG: N-acetylmuramoyl-L-alanine amidase [Elusimicrobiota bacterium]
MRFAALILWLSACAFPLHAAEPPSAEKGVGVSSPTPWVEVVWPQEGHRYPYLSRSFTFGNVTPGSTLTINNQMVQPDGSGAFFSMVSLTTGTAALEYNSVWNGLFASARRVVEVTARSGLPEAARGAAVALEPAVDKELRPGDLVFVRCAGPSGLSGSFEIEGLADGLPMVETGASEPDIGFYEGHYYIQPDDRGEGLSVTCSLRKSLWRRFNARAPGKITVADPRMTRTAVTTAKVTVVKSSRQGYSLFLPPGIKLEATGRSGGLVRVRLSEHEKGWVDESGVDLLPEGAPPPRGIVGRWVKTDTADDAVRVLIHAPERLPFEVRHSIEPLAFDIRFFGAYQRFDRIRYASDDPVVREVLWRQESSRVVRIRVETRMRWGWGYDAYYDGKGHFVLEIRRPPDLTRAKNVLAGRRVVIDAGHGPQESAVGPLGTTERDVNLGIAEELRDLLSAEGADVYMIRTSSDGPPLIDRAFLAVEQRGDLYVSVHNNGFRVTADPFEQPRGYMIFYYHPQSRPLVEAVHGSYRERHPELADEFVRWGDLYVCRITQMPSILTESAYMVLPEHEARLRDADFRRSLARTMMEGMRSFYLAYRGMQLKSEDERRAARR